MEALLKPEGLVDQDDGDALGDDLSIDDKDLAHRAVDAVCRLGSGILQRKAYSLIRRKPSSRSDTIFCVPHHQDDSPGTADVRPELAATHRGCKQRTGLGDRVNAAEHHIRRCR